jgi:hypothetical protein
MHKRGGAVSTTAYGDGRPNAAITSDLTRGLLDFVRQEILSLQHFAEQSDDDQDIHAVTKCITALQGVIAGYAKDREAAMGVTPSLRHVQRASSGNY